jgi:response regulator RpfG family c-di-GMP phosphodiesterase
METENYIKTETDLIVQNLTSVWIDLLDARNLESKEHARRVSVLAAKFAKKLGLDFPTQKNIYFGALLHDIGKLGLNDAVLLKKESLTDKEFNDVKQHALFAKKMMEDSPYLSSLIDIPYFHHERWDGQGYPDGKKGENIPFCARLYAIVDTWDALTNDRPFRKACQKNKAVEILKEGSGSQFDPTLVVSFIQMIEEREVSGEGKTIIMIVDDEPHIRLALSDIFSREGFDCRTAGSSKEALTILEMVTPALIISDIMMPSMNGFDFKRALQLISSELGDIPFIFLSAKTSKQDIMEGYELKIDDYITKPFDPMELLAKVKAILRRSELIKKQEELSYSRQITDLSQVITKNTAHELKSPLGIIIGNLEVVMRKFKDMEDPLVGMCLTDAQTSALRLQNVIDQLLYLYKIDNHILSDVTEEIDIEKDVISTIKDAMIPWRVKNLNLHLDIDPGIKLALPYNGFVYTIAQLVDNACKFANHDGRIQVSFQQQGQEVVFSVENDGAKIPVALREKVFDRFFQISNGTSRQSSGLGLGLSIVRDYADSSGGSIEISETKLGTCVSLHLPLPVQSVISAVASISTISI